MASLTRVLALDRRTIGPRHPQSYNAARARLLGGALLCLLPLLGAANPPREKPLTTVADLRYGVALYHYFMDRNLDALSELMVAQARGGIKGHGDNPEIMQGGFYLAYGMERTAAETFTRLLADNRPMDTRDAAWFYLARLRYLRGDRQGAEAALANVSTQPKDTLAQEVLALRVNMAAQGGETAEAQRLLADPRLAESSWLPYLHFNLGAAFARAQQFDPALHYFDRLLFLEDFDTAELALYDKAMTAAGYSFLLKGNYESALNAFTRVRLDSPSSQRALLGYGWAAVAREDYATALKPWQVLAKRPLVDENVQEVLVAIPYAYEKMGYTGLALEHFQSAQTQYLQHMSDIDQVAAKLQGQAIREALQIERADDVDWLNYAKQSQLSPELVYLVKLFADESFLGLTQQLRDLLAIQDNLRDWQSKLALYSAMLDEREANRSREVEYLDQQQVDTKVAALTERRDRLADAVQKLEQDGDFLALLSPEQTEKLERIERAENNIDRLNQAAARGRAVMPTDELAQLAETLRLQKGQLIWQSAQQFETRLTFARRQLAVADESLKQLQARLGRIENLAGQSLDIDPYRQQIADAQRDLRRQSSDIENAIEQVEAHLRQAVLTVLDGHKQRLQGHLAQARLGIARLMDTRRTGEQSPAEPQPEAAL